tara:strand:+ start:10974 stop:12425 length:1452 start_codon:yes stop_codon:yes gene_type:complete
MSNLQKVFKDIKKETKNYIYDIKSGNKIFYNDIYKDALKKYTFLSKYKNRKILVIINNSIDYLELLLATILSGNIFCPIPYFTSSNEIKKTYNYLNPIFLITDKELLIDIKKKDRVIHIHKLKIFNDKFKINLIKNSDIACIYYSSGTTSDPKGVLYSHNNIFYLINSINRDFKFHNKSKHLVCLPFGHTASINYSILPSLFLKSTLIIAESFLDISDKFFYLLSLYKITYVQLVPTIAIMLLKINENINKLNFKSIDYIGCGSSTLPKEIQDQFFKKFNLKLANLYGLSETGPSHFDNPILKTWKSGLIGKPLSVNKCKISKEGEILLKGKNIFVGYYKNKKLYDKVVKNGWFKTGDLGKKISSNTFQFIDRKKDLIIKGGINIVPAEIEEYFYTFTQIKEVAVVGIEDTINGEEIYCCITLKNRKDYKKLLENINSYLKKNISSFKIPKKIFIIDKMPLTKSGKIKRKDAKILIKEELNNE